MSLSYSLELDLACHEDLVHPSSKKNHGGVFSTRIRRKRIARGPQTTVEPLHAPLRVVLSHTQAVFIIDTNHVP